MRSAGTTAARTSLAILAAVLCTQSAELSLPKAAGAPGSSLILPVSFASQSSAVVSLQFDVQYDNSAVAVSATIGESARTSGKTLALGDLAPGRTRFLISGLNMNPLVDGAVITLFLNLSPNVPAGTSTLKIGNLAASDSSAHAATVKTTDGSVTIQGTAGSGPRLLPEGLLNGASLLPGPVTPGEIITLLGAGIGPTLPQVPANSASNAILDGTSVLFDGTPAPLLYASPNQINAIAPYVIANTASTQVQVTQGGVAIAELRLSVADASPALFTVDASGAGQAAILNQDSTANSPSNPAGKGSTIVLFATGAGQTDPPGTDGQTAAGILPKPLLPVSVNIGGLEAKVVYAGAAPGLIAGALQVNCILPADAPSGYAVPIALYIGKTGSPLGATIAVR